jgi:transcriptional regulator with XRE-family HTH domain
VSRTDRAAARPTSAMPFPPTEPEGPRFPENLTELIRAQGGAPVRRRLRAELGISPATLSQYESGQARPSYERLLGLARVLGVGLDELVYGHVTSGRPPAAGPWNSALDLRLLQLRAAADLQAETTARVARALAQRLDQVARELVGRLPPHPGLLGDTEGAAVEACSRHTRTFALRLESALVHSVDQELVAPGPLLRTIAQNLIEGRRYTFLLGGAERARCAERAVELRRLLRDSCGCSLADLGRCLLLHSRDLLPCGFVLYELDPEQLEQRDPLVAELVAPHLDRDGFLGAVQPPEASRGYDMLMDRAHLARARVLFEQAARRAADDRF